MFSSIFDELRKEKYFKEITDFKTFNVKYLKDIKRLKSLQKAETCLEPNKHLHWSFFVNTLLTVFYFRNKISVIDIRLGYIQTSENIEIFNVNLRWIIAIVTTSSVTCFICSSKSINTFLWTGSLNPYCWRSIRQRRSSNEDLVDFFLASCFLNFFFLDNMFRLQSHLKLYLHSKV